MNALTRFSLAVTSLFVGCSARANVDTTPVASFDLNRYMGRWYEIARFDHIFERGLSSVTATYSLQKDGLVRVENSGMKNGSKRTAIGKAKVSSAKNLAGMGSFEVSFFGPFYSPYRVIMLSDDYSYALVTSGPKYLWVLSRTPKLPIPTVEKILAEAARRGFDTKKLIFVAQD